jgi:hypothetical protein
MKLDYRKKHPFHTVNKLSQNFKTETKLVVCTLSCAVGLANGLARHIFKQENRLFSVKTKKGPTQIC